jgi:hypothetical protein
MEPHQRIVAAIGEVTDQLARIEEVLADGRDSAAPFFENNPEAEVAAHVTIQFRDGFRIRVGVGLPKMSASEATDAAARGIRAVGTPPGGEVLGFTDAELAWIADQVEWPDPTAKKEVAASVLEKCQLEQERRKAARDG